MRSLLRFLLSRPVGILVGSVAALLLGVLAFGRIRLQLMPDGFESRWMSVRASLRDSSPQEAERLVAIPIEEALATVSGIETVSTRCEPGSVDLNLQLKRTAHLPTVEREVRDRLSRVEPRLPDDVDRIHVRRHNPADMPVIMFAVRGEAEAIERAALSDLVEEVLIPGLEAIGGVARANSWGLVKRAVRIRLDREEVSRLRLNLYELVQRLRGDNLSADLGEFEEGGRNSSVRAAMEFRSLEEIERFPVRPGIALGKIAEIGVYKSLTSGWGRFNGKPVIGCAVFKTSGANTVEVCDRVTGYFEEVQGADPRFAGVSIRPFFNQGREIRASVGTLYDNALYGGLLAVGVLYLFFRRVRMTLLVSAAIPLSLTLGLTALYFSGGTLNMFSMMGFTLAVGMLIDNAIVVVEAILRRREGGDPPREAAARGTGEVALAVLTATCTTIIVFLPAIFLVDDHNARVFLTTLGGPIAFALLASLAVALVLVPMGAVRLRRRTAQRPGRRRGRAVEGLRSLYARLLGGAMNRRVTVVAVSLGFLVSAGAVAWPRLRKTRSFEGAGRTVRVGYRFPRHFTLEDGDRAVARYEEYLMGRLEELELEGVYARFDKPGGRIIVWQKAGSRRTLDEVRTRIMERWPKVPGVRVRTESFGQEGLTKVALSGDDARLLARGLDLLAKRLEAMPFVSEVQREEDLGTQELQVRLAPEAVERLQINRDWIRGTIGWVVRGARLKDYRSPERDLPLLLEIDPDDTREATALGHVLVPTGTGVVPLATVADFGIHRAPVGISRRDGRRISELTVRGNVRDLQRLDERVRRAVAATPLPPGVRVEMRGGWRDFQEDFGVLVEAFGLAVVLIFLLTGVLFEALLLPLAVLFTILPALAGSIWLLHLFDKPLEEMTLVGFILLSGVVVNNGIVLVDRIQQWRRRGLPLRAAVVRAGRDRLRPVLMTALTTIVGLLPMALAGRPESGVGYDGLAVMFIGGLAASTLLTLFLVPVAFTLFVDLSRALHRSLRFVSSGLFRRRTRYA
ncbi:MAG: efflux RND transporter permease subunit [Planctomycetota bacterium]